MSDDQFNDPELNGPELNGPELNGVGPSDGRDEYTDQELSRAFGADPVPQHGPDFWSTLQAGLSAENPGSTAATESPGSTATEQTLAPEQTSATEQMSATDQPPTGGPTGPDSENDRTAPLQVVAGQSGPGSDETELLNVVPIDRPRRSVLPMLIAAAMIAVVGLGVAALVIAANNQTTVDTSPAEPDVSVDDEGSSETTVPVEDEDAADDQSGDSDTGDTETAQPPLPVDYFENPQVASISPGRIVGFSPDESSVLIIADTTGPELGCEGAPILELYAQELATGVRVKALPEGMTVETGGLEFTEIEDNGDGSQTVTWVDFCDGTVFSARTGQLTPAGLIEGVEEFSVEPDAMDVAALEVTSPDGTAVLTVDGDVARVQLVGDAEGSGEDAAEWTLDQPDLRVGSGSFDPTGQVVAIAGTDVVHLWEFRTDRLVTVPVLGAFDTDFSRSGELLRVQSFEPNQGATLVVFDGGQRTIRPLAEDTEDTEDTGAVCSGIIELPALSVDDLMAAGLSQAAADTAVAIDVAAAQCDGDALAALAGEDFTASFGGGGVEFLLETDAAGSGALATLRQLLRQPFGVQQTDGDTALLHAWPAAFVRPSCDDFTDEDRRSLAELGYTEDDIARDCDALGGYAGWRVGIDADGNWLFYVAGD